MNELISEINRGNKPSKTRGGMLDCLTNSLKWFSDLVRKIILQLLFQKFLRMNVTVEQHDNAQLTSAFPNAIISSALQLTTGEVANVAQLKTFLQTNWPQPVLSRLHHFPIMQYTTNLSSSTAVLSMGSFSSHPILFTQSH